MTNPANYYNRFSDDKNYDEHLFIAGRVLQSAEMNEIQAQHSNRLKKIADVLFKDGDIIRDASISVDSGTGVVTCQSGAIYIKGAVRGVPPATLTSVPMTGTVAVGVRLVETVITEAEDPDLRDPAAGQRGYYEPGALRLQVTPTWGTATGGTTNFYPVYTITDGQLDAKEPPPNLDSITQAIARYDRDSAGGCYVVSGLTVKQLPDSGSNQVFTIAEGRARVYGFGVEYPTARRVTLAATPDLKSITNEPHLSSTVSAQRVNLDRAPGTTLQVTITTEKTVTLTHGIATGAQDPLPDTSVLAILSVTQGAVTYTQGTDYKLTAGKVDWSLAGAEPSPGSTYQVTYQYITLVTPTAVDDSGFTVTGAVVGTQILVSYQQKLPRIDRLCINQDGTPVWVLGVSAEYNPQPPSVPGDMLALARVYQTWDANRSVVNDGVRVVPMPQLYAIDSRLDWLAQLIAQNRLESNIHTREAGAKKGLFVDPFLDDTPRDAGTPQTAAVVNGELRLPIAATIAAVGSDISSPQTLPYTHVTVLEQKLRTGSMLINPYMTFAPVPANLVIRPEVDRWTDVQTTWASAVTSRFVVGSGDQSSTASRTRNALLSTTTSNSETLRQIPVGFTISRFGPGEILTSLTFDGVNVLSGTPVADSNGIVTGTFTIPAAIPSGSKQVRATGGGGTVATAVFTGQGTLERQVWQQQTTVTETRWQSPPAPAVTTGGGGGRGVDPLAQTFTLPENVQASGIDLWFVAKPTTTTRVQLRTTSNGFPEATVLAEAVLQPASINIGGATTRFEFQYPVYLVAGTEYAIVILCNDATGSVSVAELGKFDAANQRWITSQPYTVGVLLSSSNASTWTAHQDRDLTFRLLKASYSATSRTINLGPVSASAVTDLLLMSYAERPHSSTGMEYRLTLPDSSVVTVSDGQPVQLASAITGTVTVRAVLTGSADFSPVLFPGSQLVKGIVATTGTYVSRAIPGGNPVTVKVVLQAIVQGGAALTVEYKGQDAGDTWASVPQTGTSAADDGFTEVTYSLGSVNEVNGVQLRLTLAGTTAARPRVRDLRAFVI